MKEGIRKTKKRGVIARIVSNRRRRLRQPREPEEIEPAPRRLRPDVVRLLDAVVPSAVLRTDGAQCPSRDGRSETVWYVPVSPFPGRLS